MNFSQRVTTVTQNVILKKAVDNLLSDNFATFRFMGNGKKWDGTTLDRPLMLYKNTLGGSFSGMDTHSSNTTNTRRLMSYDVRGYEIPVAIPGMDRAVNKTDAQIINLVKIEMETAQESALDDLGTMFYEDGTGNENKDFLGLGALVDDGTNVDALGNLSRATYPTLSGTVTASGGNISLKKISTLVSTVGSGSAARQRPSIFISDETVWDLGETLLTPTVQANYNANGNPMVTRKSRGVMTNATLNGAQGFVSIVIKGIPWVADEKATASTFFGVNENYIDWYGLKDDALKQIDISNGETIDGVYADAPSTNTGFQWTGFMTPTNQYAEVAHIYALGNFVSFQPRRHGKLTGVLSA